MYRKILVPLDGSKESEGIFAALWRELPLDSKLMVEVDPKIRTGG